MDWRSSQEEIELARRRYVNNELAKRECYHLLIRCGYNPVSALFDTGIPELRFIGLRRKQTKGLE